MNANDIKKTIRAAQRSYERALRANTCGLATLNVRHGQEFELRALRARTALVGKTEWSRMTPAQRELFELEGPLPSIGYNAHLHRLKLCGVTVMQHEQRAAADRVDKTDDSRERQYRKRPKKRK